MLAIKETETPDFAAAAIIVAFSDTIILAVLTVVRVRFVVVVPLVQEMVLLMALFLSR